MLNALAVKNVPGLLAVIGRVITRVTGSISNAPSPRYRIGDALGWPNRWSGVAGRAVRGADNTSGNQRSPWPYYLCGHEKREGWSACPTGRIGAGGSEEGVFQIVTTRILPPTLYRPLFPCTR